MSRLLPALLPGAIRYALTDLPEQEHQLALQLLAHRGELTLSDRAFVIHEVNWALETGRARAVDEWQRVVEAMGGRPRRQA